MSRATAEPYEAANEIRITRVYDAPVSLVWDAWTQDEHVVHWWGPRGFSLTTHSKDLRPGGSWAYTMHGPDGKDWPNFTRYHVVEVRLARWLLMTRDRAHSNEFHLTHEFLARMLGVRRVGITKAAGLLEKRGAIDYHRGKITVLNHAVLEQAACRCYQLGKQMYERTLGSLQSA